MDHVAIDLGAKMSHVCRRESNGTIVEEKRVPTAALGRYLERLAPSCVIVETCAEAFRVADEAKKAGHTVKVVPSTLSRVLGVGARGVKTDQRDARALSETSCRIDLPSVHIPSQESRERKTMCGMRDALVSSRTQLVNTVRGWMRGQSIQLQPGAPETLSKRLLARTARMKLELPSWVERQLKAIDGLSEQIAEADAEPSAFRAGGRSADHRRCRAS
jgi:transposase